MLEAEAVVRGREEEELADAEDGGGERGGHGVGLEAEGGGGARGEAGEPRDCGVRRRADRKGRGGVGLGRWEWAGPNSV